MAKPPSLGVLINKMYRKREAYRKKDKEVEVMKSDYKKLKEEFIVACHNQGTETGKSNLAQASVVKKTVANVTDWNAFEAWIYENKALYMMFRRANVAPIVEFRDRSEDGMTMPDGTETREIFDVSLRNRSDV